MDGKQCNGFFLYPRVSEVIYRTTLQMWVSIVYYCLGCLLQEGFGLSSSPILCMGKALGFGVASYSKHVVADKVVPKQVVWCGPSM